MHGIPLRGGVFRPVPKEQHRSEDQTEYQKRDRRKSGDRHQSTELYPGKEQGDGRDGTGGKQQHDDPQTDPDGLDRSCQWVWYSSRH